MAINIVVETGAQVVGANSYVSAGDLQTYATNRGYALPVAGDPQAILLIKAADYLEAQRNRYQGEKVSVTQAMQWPRDDVYIDGSSTVFADTSIPNELKNAQCELACKLAADTSLDLFPVRSGAFVVEERVEGAVDVKYSETLNTDAMPRLPFVDALLAPLFKSGFSGCLPVTRV